MENKRVKEIAMISIFTALVIAFAMIPMVGYVQLGIIALTTVHIPVLIGGTFGGRRTAYYLATVFGISSLIYSFIAPAGLNIAFQNPMVSIVPRVLWGFAFYEIYLLTTKYISNKYVGIAVHMVVSTLIHTIIVSLFLWAFSTSILEANMLPSNILPLFWLLLSVNGVFEALAAGLIGAPIAQRLLKYKENDLM